MMRDMWSLEAIPRVLERGGQDSVHLHHGLCRLHTLHRATARARGCIEGIADTPMDLALALHALFIWLSG